MRRIGFLGGTFDPPHSGHLNAARAACDGLKLEKLLLIPTYIPPHKTRGKNGASPLQRLEMTRLMALSDPRFEADDREMLRGGRSYTYDTAVSLLKDYPSAELWMVCGSDMFFTLENWYRAAELLKAVKVAAVPREKGESEKMTAFRDRLAAAGSTVMVLDVPPVDISSTVIRGGFEGGVLPSVAEYIQNNGLYATK